MPGPSSRRSESRSSSSTPRGNLSAARPKVTSVIKQLPRPTGSRGPSPSHRGQGSTEISTEGQVYQELHLHDERVQTLNVGVDPAEYGRVVSEAQRLLEEADSKARSLEGLAQAIYMQACGQIQHLVTVVNELQQSCSTRDSSIQALQFDLNAVRSQLEHQIALNQSAAAENSRLISENSTGLRTLEHKNTEMDRLMNLVSQRDSVLRERDVVTAELQSRCEGRDASLAAFSASCQQSDPNVVARAQPEVVRDLLSQSVLEAVHLYQTVLIPLKTVRAIIARQCLLRFRLLVVPEELRDQGFKLMEMMEETVLRMKTRSLFEISLKGTLWMIVLSAMPH